ncbi:MAG: DUF3943 domain-containing protein [Mucilaginibacter sp.]
MKCFIFFVLFGLSVTANAQVAPAQRLKIDTLPQKLQKHFGRSALEFGLAETLPWLLDNYGSGASWANISFKSIGHNIKPSSWAWDNDQFQTNQIGHPFHGSIFYNAFRSNGYNFWQSAPATLVGSYIWETFCETQAPSVNDLINTSFGGIMLGEVSHRMASKLIHNRSHGLKRQVSEAFASFINPSNGLTRLLDGQWGKPDISPAEIDTTPLKGELDMGMRKFNVNNKDVFRDGHFGPYGRLSLMYGVPEDGMKAPFSHISLVIEAGKDDSSRLNIVSLYGSLAGWKIYMRNNTIYTELSANYDYINNEAFYYSAEGVRMNFYAHFNLPEKSRIDAAAGAGALFLAAIPDHYTWDSRNYDYGPGASYYGSCKFTLAGLFFYNAAYRGGWMTTINGNKSYYLLHVFTNDVGINLTHAITLTAQQGYFNLHGTYRAFPPVNKTYPYLRVAIRYSITL